jgi:tetratricopeptide (TPR) repeat protein
VADRDTLRRIQALARSGDVASAANLAEEALASGPEHPFLLNLVAAKRENEGHPEQAADLLRRALEIEPNDVGCRHALGILLNSLEMPQEALEHFDSVIRVHSGFAPAHACRGAALEALGVLDAAADAYRRALELQAGNLLALAGLASLHSRRGQHASARQLAEQVLRIEPNYPNAVMSLAAAEIAAGVPKEAEVALRSLLADPRPSRLEKSLARGALGDALDAQERFDEAFEAYADANEERRILYAGRFASGGRTTLEHAQAMNRYFQRTSHGDWKRSTSSAMPPPGVRGHVFLIGFPRSGTTLLEQVLASHEHVDALEERETLLDAMREYLREPENLDRLAHASASELDRFRALYWQRAVEAGARVHGKFFVDKHPLNGLKLPLIARLFPEARVLLALRDPRDVILSCFRRRFGMSAPYYQLLTLPGAAALYDAVMQLTDDLNDLLQLPTMEVRLEGLIADFDGEARRICGFIGLEWSDSLRDFAARVRERNIVTPSAAQLAGGLTASGVGHWRHYRDHLAPVMPVLKQWIARFGYPAS